MTYNNIASKFFKNRAKKTALSLNFTATRYSGNAQDQILAPISRKWLRFSQYYPLEIYFRAPKSAFSIVIFLGEHPYSCIASGPADHRQGHTRRAKKYI
jgi:hypothetical protein